ncbi:hypothetical protein BT96DRAFT_1007444 [Gymnopus androsaceus JB14]|uniref:RING-type domain-containing protein n=1 Tax=Gymnopus androsaceus JB14 TaxID=1447944 RepID=A0A6A4GHQ1_9AGAR|nr:hypothetical protein BT96DRAFT_1007444 [Gymnopus androsaceus JB14]
MPLCNSPTKSTTTARDFANSPPYSPAKTPARTYGSKGKNRIPSRQSATALAYQELEVLPLPTVHAAADSGGSETIDSDDEIIFISQSSRAVSEQKRVVLPVSNVRSGLSSANESDEDVILVSGSKNVSREQKLKAELADATQRALDAHELLRKTQNDLKALYQVQVERFNCGICTFTLKNPHACGHIYCEGCIADYFDHHLLRRTKKLLCPTCRREIGREPPAALHLLNDNIGLMIKEGGLDASDLFADNVVATSLDWDALERRRRRQFPVSP